ncbi:MAG: SufS family cysteine desulfurase [Prolixibacteraceae bacterium]|nr:SufS family cysteine desulfurase [Prolixibacteraceae bacterium]MBN2774758.1 SufS family cysteine desulfurase [Prolixibacteraceae bacterium]
MSYDINKIRSYFPVLNQQVYSKPLVYLDSAASTQKPVQVLEAEKRLHNEYYGNIHRAAHYMADKATADFEVVRNQVKLFINASSTEEIIFTKGTTESVNLVAFSFGERFISEGDEIIVSEMEHHSNIVPWQLMAERKKAIIKVLPFNDKGELLIDKLDELITPRTKILTVAHISNVLGTVNPIKEIITKAHQKNVAVFIDGAQGFQHSVVDVKNLDADFYAFSAHKAYGPNGVGILYGKKFWLEQMPPYQGGGEMISEVTFSGTTFNELPYKFEAGTPNITSVIAFGATLDLLQEVGLGNITAWEEKIIKLATNELKKINEVRSYGEASKKSGVISFNHNKIHPYDLGMLLDKTGVAVRTGHHCADPVMQHFNIPGTVRISFGMYTSEEDIALFIQNLKRIITMF